ncbi:hypothetical protein GPECTOR_18g68 [Gonium pectorale]|uniref:Uncharacterized protein n=1 Tax=Gonium pectorale TaxID=33097 RepID=A0A150GJV9_GONPE|nr:hypothetical protein GPECTOR_18g68 [Gonium pectorale]|eukprot:KXZ50091.1 hypothetical protein GPECTOR_18g68 [Gonium pectorale]
MAKPQAAYTRRLLLVNRTIAGTLLLGVASLLTGLVEVRVYKNEVDYTKDSAKDAEQFKPHRCNDRLADMLDVIESEEGNAWRDLRPTFRNWWACMRSPEGMEPAMPYIMLSPKDKQYIDPAHRHPDARQQEGGQRLGA